MSTPSTINTTDTAQTYQSGPDDEDVVTTALTTPGNRPDLATNTSSVLVTRGLLTSLAAGAWLPSGAEEIVAALQLLAQELQLTLNTPDPALAGIVRPNVAARVAWQ